MAGAGMVPGASAPDEPGAGGWCGVRKRTAADAGTSAVAGRIRRFAGLEARRGTVRQSITPRRAAAAR